MDNRERIYTVFEGKTPDRIPFAPFSDVMPEDDFVNRLIERGMGIIGHFPTIFQRHWGYEITEKSVGGKTVITYHTPVGDVSEEYEKPLSKTITGHTLGIQTGFMIKHEKDYEAAIYVIDHTEYMPDAGAYHQAEKLLGGKGIIHTWTGEPPFMGAQYILGLENWSFHQYDCPEEFKRLLDALGRRQEKRLLKLLESQERLINLGNLAGNFGPAQFEEHMIPYFRKYSSLFSARGKYTTIHADANNLKMFRTLIPQTGVDIIEAFTPPPFGDLGLVEARKAWGEEKTIWINFPEAVFYNGYDYTRQYTVELIKSDPCPNKLLGLTEMGLLGVDESNERLFRDGITAIMDAIDEAGGY